MEAAAEAEEEEEDVPTAAMLAFWNAGAAASPSPQPPPQPPAQPARARRESLGESPTPGSARGGRPSPPLSLADISRALPHGWAAVRDESGGRTYYWHEATGATSWRRPSEAHTEAKEATTAAAAKAALAAEAEAVAEAEAATADAEAAEADAEAEAEVEAEAEAEVEKIALLALRTHSSS